VGDAASEALAREAEQTARKGDGGKKQKATPK